MSNYKHLFDSEVEKQLPALLGRLPRPVRLHLWGDGETNERVREAQRLIFALSEQFDTIDHRILPTRANYHYYPVIGAMGLEEDQELDFGVRIIGLPEGVQITSLIAAIQSVSFRGMTSEARTRILLKQIETPVTLELITSKDDEGGTLMAHQLFNMAVSSEQVGSYLIMGDAFPQAVVGYSVKSLPHIVINKRVHVEGIVDEMTLMKHIASAVTANQR